MTNPIIRGENYLRPLHRHFINIMCTASGPLVEQQFNRTEILLNYSAFLVDIDGHWLAITAGHIFQELEKYITHGITISGWQIDDSTVSDNPEPPYPISLDISEDVIWITDSIPGTDYAGFVIHPLARQALSKQGIEAISSEVWLAADTNDYNCWLLVGTPTCFAKLDQSQPIQKNHATIILQPVGHVPFGLDDTEFHRLYARIDFSSVMHVDGFFNIKGMSGGPVFAIKSFHEDPISSYRIIGIQSSWDNDQHVAICQAKPFIEALMSAIRKYKQEQLTR